MYQQIGATDGFPFQSIRLLILFSSMALGWGSLSDPDMLGEHSCLLKLLLRNNSFNISLSFREYWDSTCRILRTEDDRPVQFVLIGKLFGINRGAIQNHAKEYGPDLNPVGSPGHPWLFHGTRLTRLSRKSCGLIELAQKEETGEEEQETNIDKYMPKKWKKWRLWGDDPTNVNIVDRESARKQKGDSFLKG
jgi:hypothetical protein